MALYFLSEYESFDNLTCVARVLHERGGPSYSDDFIRQVEPNRRLQFIAPLHIRQRHAAVSGWVPVSTFLGRCSYRSLHAALGPLLSALARPWAGLTPARLKVL